jgi:glycosyltransferase involved in cell wall biosynthesis
MHHTILIASVMRPEGETGIQTHFKTFLAALIRGGRSCALMTPYLARRWKIYPLFGLRWLVDPLSRPASVWWYRHWHAHFLEQVLRRRLRNGEPAIVYAQCPMAARAALRARVSPLQRVVMAVHFNLSEADEWAARGSIASDGPLFRAIRDMEADVLPRLDGLVFVSAFMRKCLLARIPAVLSLPYAVVPNFVDDPGLPIRSLPEGDLISIGTMEPRKNQSYLLDIVAAARAKGRPLRLTLYGDGPDRTALEQKARSLHLQPLVRFPGFVRDAAQALGRHRAYVHAARLENMPLTLIEALSRAVPVFAPAVGGVPEIFDDGVEGRILPLDDAAAAADRIIEWMNRPERLAHAATAARSRFLREFQTGVAATRLADFLDALLDPVSGSAHAFAPPQVPDAAFRKAARLG